MSEHQRPETGPEKGNQARHLCLPDRAHRLRQAGETVGEAGQESRERRGPPHTDPGKQGASRRLHYLHYLQAPLSQEVGAVMELGCWDRHQAPAPPALCPWFTSQTPTAKPGSPKVAARTASRRSPGGRKKDHPPEPVLRRREPPPGETGAPAASLASVEH